MNEINSTHPPFGPPLRTSCGTTDIPSSIPPANFVHTPERTRWHESNHNSVKTRTGRKKRPEDVPALTACFHACTYPGIDPGPVA